MHLFYDYNLPGEIIKGAEYQLPEDEARHAVKVLRLNAGSIFYVTNGRGIKVRVRMIAGGKKEVRYRVEEVTKEEKRKFSLHIAVGPVKNIKRFEWFLEKATEAGIEEITPVISFHSERREIKIARSVGVITAAVKQSLKSWHPVLNEAVKFNDFITRPFPGQKFMAHYTGPEQVKLKNILKPGEDVVILIGPEGDFSREEVEAAQKAGFTAVSLGDTRLRTETAALAATFIANFVNDL